METTANAILKGVLTQSEIDESHALLAKIGAEGSKARIIAFDLMKLAESIRQATIPNQEWFYETANLEQYAYQLRAVKEIHGLDYDKIRDGLNWLREQGLLEQSYQIPDCLETLKIKARCRIQERNEKLAQKVKDSENGKKDGKRKEQTDWQSIRTGNDG